ncbi:MAG: family 16 glycoside hydrolase [Pyrinomonadaceae bacterium]
MNRRAFVTLLLALAVSLSIVTSVAGQQQFPLDTTKGLSAGKGLKIVVTEYLGRKAVRPIVSAPDGQPASDLVMVDGTNFQDGIIEVDVAAKGVPPFPGARAPGFIGIAFRVQPNDTRYEYFYIRPGNSRSGDQAMRNHATQYAAFPGFGWPVSRRQWPWLYESHADLEPGAWTKMRIEVAGRSAKLYVNGSTQPCLVVEGMRNEDLRGGVGLYVGPGTEAYFSNLRITPSPTKQVMTGTDAAGSWTLKIATDMGPQEAEFTFKRDGAKIDGIYSGTLGRELPVTGTWRSGFIELKLRGTWTDPRGQGKDEVEAVLAGWLQGNSGSGHIVVAGKTQGTWTADKSQ